MNIYGRYVQETFPADRLTNSFKNFRLDGCTDEIGRCWKMHHEKAKTCTTKFRDNPKFEMCMRRPDISGARKAFRQSSFDWHTSFDLCLAGNECENCSDDVQNAEGDEEEDDAIVNENNASDNGTGSLEKLLGDCWNIADRDERNCLNKSLRCVIFANCFGKGQRPIDQRLSRWYTSVKAQRERSANLQKSYMTMLFNCVIQAEERGYFTY